MNRKQRRAIKKEAKGAGGLSEKVTLFGSLPDICNICKKVFDKKRQRYGNIMVSCSKRRGENR